MKRKRMEDNVSTEKIKLRREVALQAFRERARMGLGLEKKAVALTVVPRLCASLLIIRPYCFTAPDPFSCSSSYISFRSRMGTGRSFPPSVPDGVRFPACAVLPALVPHPASDRHIRLPPDCCPPCRNCRRLHVLRGKLHPRGSHPFGLPLCR